jgi:hypothetical protein
MLQAELEEAQRKLETLKAEMMADIYLPRPPDKTTTPEAHFAAGAAAQSGSGRQAQQGGIETDRIAAPLQHRTLQIIVE